MFGAQANLFGQFAISGLLCGLIRFDAALRKLPGVMLRPLRPQHLVIIITDDDPHVGSEAIFVYHVGISRGKALIAARSLICIKA